ncbi:MAG: ImmA/IrrE family metallo-endopeptidase [Abitibacteriaceae bacterium]|nr:ImmA/IrrE family metallo-endopeptidase [Abditibacteriaceae bacterium]
MKPIWRRQQVEDLALITLLDFRRQTGLPLTPPLDVDLVGEITCRLQWDWDVLQEPPGTLIWAALFPEERSVVLNEAHKDRFAEKSGLERFTKGHEIGHWILHVKEKGDLDPAHATPQQQIFCRGGETHAVNWVEKHADWFAGALLMPASVFVPIAEQYDLAEWKSLYELAKLFDVTISALCVRLAHLGLSYVDENGHLQAPPVVSAQAHNNNSHHSPLPHHCLPRRKAAPQQARRHPTPIPVATTTKTNRESVNPR